MSVYISLPILSPHSFSDLFVYEHAHIKYACIPAYQSIYLSQFFVSMPVSLYLYRLIFLPQGIQIYGRIHILFFYFIHFLFLSVYFTFTLYLVLCFFFSFYLFLCLRPLDFGAVDSNVLQSVTFEFDLQCTSYQ